MSTHRETADRIINAMIVDDDSLIVESLATILSAQPDINVCATASGGTEAVQIYAKLASESVSRETSSARTTKEGAANATAVTATDDVAPSAAPDAPAAVPDDAPAVPDNAPTATLTSATVAPDAPAPNDAAPVAATDTAAPATPAPDDATPASAATLDAAAPTTAPDTPTPAVPDVLLMDIRMPDGDGLSAAERILADYPQARIIFLTTFADDDYIVRALRMGARGYLIKQDVATIAPALRSVMAGQNVLGSEVMERAFFLGNVSRETSTTPSAPSTTSVTLSPAEASALSTSSSPAALAADSAPLPSAASSAPAAPTAPAAPFPALTERERRIVELVAQGLDNREIAGIVYVSEGTVRNHISTILSKLNLRNRTQIAVHYWRSLSR